MVGGASRSVWVDRERELAVLDGSLAQVRARSPRAVLIMGETGVGKTALVQEFARRAGVRAFIGRCFKFGGSNVPYLPLVEILRSFAREADGGEVVRVLGPARSDVARLLPELAPRGDGVRGSVRGEGSNLERARLFERLLGVAERLGRDEPTVIVVEDAHWIDDSTRDTLVFLLHSVRQSQLMLVITCRSEELPPGHPFLTITAELERAGILERLDLNRLARPDVEKQIAGLVGRAPDTATVDRIVARSGGNPLFVEELVKVGGGADDRSVPVGLRDILLGRIATLSAPAQALVRFAAIAGPSVDEPVLAAAGLTGSALTSALREAAAEQVLVPSEKTGRATYNFRHPLLQEVVYDDELPVERARAHAAIAQVLSKEESTAPDATAQLAHHWFAAHEYAHALPAAIQAGIAAYLAYAFAEAFRQFDRAITLWPQVPFADDRVGIDYTALLEYASESATRIGDYPRAIELGKQQLAAIDPAAEPARAAAAHSRMRWTLWESGDHRAALADAQEAARLVPADPPSVLRANVLGHLAALLMFGGEVARALALARESAEIAHGLGQPALAEEALAVGTIGLCLVRLGDVDDGLARIREALTIAERLEHVTGIAVAYAQYAGALDQVGRAEDTVAVAQQGIAAAQRLGLERTFGALLRGSAAHALYDLGRWDEAEALTASARASTDAAHEQSAALVGALIAIGRGNLDQAKQTLMEMPAAAPQAGSDELERLRLLAQAELLLAEGRPAEVGALLKALPAEAATGPSPLQGEVQMLAVRAEADIAGAARAAGNGVAAAEAGGRARKLVGKMSKRKDVLSAALRAAAEAEEMRAVGNRTKHFVVAATNAWQQAKRPYRLAYAAFRGIL